MPPPDLDTTFLTVNEVAEALRLNPQTVRNWIDQGSLPALRVGRRVRIRRSDFERLLEEGYSGRRQRQAQAAGQAPAENQVEKQVGNQVERQAEGHASSQALAETPGPSAEDFWSGEAVGLVRSPTGESV